MASPAGPGWAPADIKARYDEPAWVLGWARFDEYQAGAKYVGVMHLGSLPGQRLPRARVVFR